jgi:hypothetical protein
MTLEINIIIRCIETLIKNIVAITIFFITPIIFMCMCDGRKIIHLFLYNPMIKESGWIPQSIHETRKGAELAMESHKEEVIKDLQDKTRNPIEAAWAMDWRLCEYELLT